MFVQSVAGAGFAPAPQGYEPCELLLLNPAVFFIISLLKEEYQAPIPQLRNRGF